jgi:hypothetical protein
MPEESGWFAIPHSKPHVWVDPPYVDRTFDEAEMQRDFDEAIAGDDYDDDCGHDESVCDTFDDHLTYG